jgi:cephalosporin hydroxylase
MNVSLGFLLLVIFSAVPVEGVRNRRIRGSNTTSSNATAAQQPVTFRQWYDSHNEGRGIWKWANALDAYQQLFAGMIGQPVSVAEVGVQSGGSILMWKAALGAQIKFFGLDINPGCNQFKDATTSITIGDQADPQMWNTFYTSVVSTLDVLVDDGGHTPPQMLVTLQMSFPRLNPGGLIAIEDIHGRQYVQTFFHPAAQSISAWHIAGQVDSVHVYPFLMVLQKVGGTRPALNLPVSETVDSFPAFYALLDSTPGQNIAIENAAWGSFLSAATLSNIFTELAPLHDYALTDNPPGCATTTAPKCVNTITNSNYQAKVTGVHIYAQRMVMEIAAKPVVINAVRKGTEWLPYGF